MTEEGGYVDAPQRIDQPTNIGITQPTLDNYRKNNPDANMPAKVRDLSPQHAEQIYATQYFDNRRIGEIKNTRIAGAIFDMGVMSNFRNVGKIVQKTLNQTMGANLHIDGIIGNKTIDEINQIPDVFVNQFMGAMIENRLKYLQKLPTWPKFGKGWTARTRRY